MNATYMKYNLKGLISYISIILLGTEIYTDE